MVIARASQGPSQKVRSLRLAAWTMAGHSTTRIPGSDEFIRALLLGATTKGEGDIFPWARREGENGPAIFPLCIPTQRRCPSLTPSS